MKLIDKDAALADIERLKDSVPYFPTIAEKEAYREGVYSAYCKVSSLKEKEMDLEKEIDCWYQNKASKEFENVFYGDIEKCAKYFFELGLKVQKGEKV